MAIRTPSGNGQPPTVSLLTFGRSSTTSWNCKKSEILHPDEAHDLYQNANILQRISIITTLKTLMQNNQWPVCLVLSGTENLDAPLYDDQQFGRRLAVFRIVPLNYAADRKMICEIVAHFSKEAGFTSDLGDESDFIRGLIVVAVGRMDRGIDVVIGAAVLNGARHVTVPHFVAAYHRRIYCDVSKNPFLAEEWRVIDARKVLSRDGKAKHLAPVKEPAFKQKQVEED